MLSRIRKIIFTVREVCFQQCNMCDLITYLPLSRCHTQQVVSPLALALRNVVIHTDLVKYSCNSQTVECGLKTEVGEGKELANCVRQTEVGSYIYLSNFNK